MPGSLALAGVLHSSPFGAGTMQGEADKLTDVALLERVAARDGSAVSVLYDRYSAIVFGLATRILRDRAEAEEVLQEVFLLAWTRSETYDAALGSPAAWLIRIARNRAIDRLRSRRLRLVTAESQEIESPAASPEAVAAAGERERAVACALRALPADQRTLIEHAYFVGLSQSELAARFHLPLGTVKTRIRTGMMALRQQLHDSLGGPAPRRDATR